VYGWIGEAEDGVVTHLLSSAPIGQAASTLGLVSGRSVKRRLLFEVAACVRSTRRRAEVVWAGVLGCVGG
jgi:hypothetical protein